MHGLFLPLLHVQSKMRPYYCFREAIREQKSKMSRVAEQLEPPPLCCTKKRIEDHPHSLTRCRDPSHLYISFRHERYSNSTAFADQLDPTLLLDGCCSQTRIRDDLLFGSSRHHEETAHKTRNQKYSLKAQSFLGNIKLPRIS